jgi:hypothetical protein
MDATGSSVSQNYMEDVSDPKVLKVTLRLREQSRRSIVPNEG